MDITFDLMNTYKFLLYGQLASVIYHWPFS